MQRDPMACAVIEDLIKTFLGGMSRQQRNDFFYR